MELTFEVGAEAVVYNAEPQEDKVLKVRLDKWLWAARFFKTRALARAAIENGKIDYNDHKTTPSKEIEIGATIGISNSQGKKVVLIKGLSTRRRSTAEAMALFEELEFTEQNHEYTPISADSTEGKTRKIVRFLRRTMNIADTSSNY